MEAQAALAQWQAWLAEPAQVAARQQSQTAYEGETSMEAAGTDAVVYPGWIGGVGYKSLDLGGVGTVVGTPGQYSASIKYSNGSRGVMVSATPLYGTTLSGSSAPVNLDLTTDGTGNYVPDSGSTQVAIPSASTGELSFPQQSFGVHFASGASVAGQQQAGTVFYPNIEGAGDDTDAVAQATPSGAEISYVLRSAESPQTQTLTFDLPSGWSLTPSVAASGGVDVTDSSGAVQAVVLPAVAVDAEGQDVPVSYQVQATNQISVTINDQGGQYAFPVDVDPVISVGNNSMFEYWQSWTTNSNNFYEGVWGGSSGFNGWQANSAVHYTASSDARGEYALLTPSYADIYELQLTGADADNNHSEMIAGLQSGGGASSMSWIGGAYSAYTNSFNNNTFTYCLNSCNPATNYGDQAAFALQMTGNTTNLSFEPYDYATGGHVYFSDRGSGNASYNPSMTMSPGPGSVTWYGSVDQPYLSVTGTSQSGELGVDQISYSVNGTNEGTDTDPTGCTISGATLGCANLGGWSNIPVNQYAINCGLNTITATVTAYDGDWSAQSYQLGADCSQPTVSLTGGNTVGAGGADALITSGATGTVTASGSGTWPSGTNSMSGVSLSGSLDGGGAGTLTGGSASCYNAQGTGCTATPTWSFAAPNAGYWHTYTVTAATANGTTSATTNFAVLGIPSIQGTFQVGQTLTAEPATFSGTPAPSYGYQWLSCPANASGGGGCTPIPNATGATYKLTRADIGSQVELQETATVTGPSASAPSSMTLVGSQGTSGIVEPTSGSCTSSWIGGASGNWNVGTDWYPTGYPSGSNSIACIPALYATSAPTVTVSDNESVGELLAPNAKLTVSNGGQLTFAADASTLGTLNLGTSSTTGTVSVPANGSTSALSIQTALNWINGTINGGTGGGGQVLLAGTSSSTIDPAATTNSLLLSGATLLNEGNLTMDCQYPTDSTTTTTAVQGQSVGSTPAVFNNQGSLTFNVSTGGSSSSDGCEFKQASGAGSVFENNGTIGWSTNTTGQLVDMGWGFDNSQPDSDVNGATIDLFAGQTTPGGANAPIDGQWSNATLNLACGGAYSITDDLANFGEQSATDSAIDEFGTPGSSTGASVSVCTDVAGASSAPSLTIATGAFENGQITANGPLALGTAGQVTNISNLVDTDTGALTYTGSVYVSSYSGTNVPCGTGNSSFTVNGTTNFTGTETACGSSTATVTFNGPVNTGSTSSITTAGPLVLAGAVTGTGNLAITAGGSIYVQGSMNVTGNVTMTNTSGDIQITGPVAATQLTAITNGRVDVAAAITTGSFSLQAVGGVDIDAAQIATTSSWSIQSSGPVDLNKSITALDMSLTLGASSTLVTNRGTLSVQGLTLVDGKLDNEDILQVEGSQGSDASVHAESGATIINDAFVFADYASFTSSATGAASSFINDNIGEMTDPISRSTPTDTIAIPFTNTGSVSRDFIISGIASSQYAGVNPADPDLVAAACDQGTDCGSGDYNTQQTDMSLAGWDGGLTLTRSYSSRLAASESAPGMFGYGWITPFEQRLYIEGDAAEVQTTTGSTANFAISSSGQITPAAGNLATLTASGSDYIYTQPDQTVTVFEPTTSSSGGYYVPATVTDAQGHATTYTYNSSGQLTKVTGASASSTAGRAITFTYKTGTNLVATATDPEGLVASYTYDANSNLLTVTDNHAPNDPETNPTTGSNQAWAFGYDDTTAGNDPADLHELTSITDANNLEDGQNNATVITYVGGYVTGVQQPGQSYAETWQYELPGTGAPSGAVGETIQMTAPIQTSSSGGAGASTTIYVNALGEPIETVYPNGTVETTSYATNGTGETLSTTDTGTDGRTETTTYGYDSYGFQVCETSPMVTAGQEAGESGTEQCPSTGTPAPTDAQSWVYNDSSSSCTPADSCGNLLSQTQPSGLVTSDAYDAQNEPTTVTVTPPSGSSGPTEVTSDHYTTPSGSPFEVLSYTQKPNGGQTHYSFDTYGDLLTETDANGNETTYGYDSDGRKVCETTPAVTAAVTGTGESGAESCPLSGTPPANAETWTYDLFGDVLTSTSASGAVTSNTYDYDQQLLTEAAPADNNTSTQNVTTYSYQLDGALQQTVQGTGTAAVTETDTYDPAGDLIEQQDSNQTYTYTYTPMQQLATETDALGNVTSYSYDSSGNLKTIVYPPAHSGASSETTTYSYNLNNQRTATSYSDSTPQAAYTYGLDGQVLTMTDGTGDTDYAYDGLDRLTGLCQSATALTTSASTCATDSGRYVGYGYDPDNNVISITYPDGLTATRTFYPDDQLNTVAVADAGTQLGTSTFNYGWDGQLTATVFPASSNETDTNAYNLDDALTSIKMSTGSTLDASLAYTRWPNDLIDTEAQTSLPGTAACDTYGYTTSGELQTDTPSASTCATLGPTPNYAYNSSRDMTELNNSGSGTFSYNNDSELTSSPAGSYTYNNLGERTGLTPISGTSSSYQYNADQNLIQATLPASGGGTATAGYNYNGNGQLISSTGPTATAFTWDDDASVPQLLESTSSGNTVDYVYGPNGAIEQVTGGSTVQYLHQDQIGSTRLITNSNGSVGGSYTYSPYGDVSTYVAGTGAGTLPGGDKSLLGYAGQYTDPTTYLIYDQARWYDPSSGQFMVIDPKVETTWTPYAYGDDDPVTETDPSGLKGIAGAGCMAAPKSEGCKRVESGLRHPNFSVDWGKVTRDVNSLIKDVGTAAAYAEPALGIAAIACAVATEGACTPLAMLALANAAGGTAADGYLTVTGQQTDGQFGLDIIGFGFGGIGVTVPADVVFGGVAEGASAFSALLEHFAPTLGVKSG